MQRVASRHRGFTVHPFVGGVARHPLLLQRAGLSLHCPIRYLGFGRKFPFHPMDSPTLRALIGNGRLQGPEGYKGRIVLPRAYRVNQRLLSQKSRGRGIETSRHCLPQKFLESASIAFRNFTNEKFNHLRKLLAGDSGPREVTITENQSPLGTGVSSESGPEGEELTGSSGKSSDEFEWRAALWEAEVARVEELEAVSEAELLEQNGVAEIEETATVASEEVLTRAADEMISVHAAFQEAEVSTVSELKEVSDVELRERNVVAGIEETATVGSEEVSTRAAHENKSEQVALQEAEVSGVGELEVVSKVELREQIGAPGIAETTTVANEEVSTRAADERISDHAALQEAEVSSVDKLEVDSEVELRGQNVVAGIEETATVASEIVSTRAADENISEHVALQEAEVLSVDEVESVIEVELREQNFVAGIEEIATVASEEVSTQTADENISKQATLQEAEVSSVGELEAVSEAELFEQIGVAGFEEAATVSTEGKPTRAAHEKIPARAAILEVEVSSVGELEAVTEAELFKPNGAVGNELAATVAKKEISERSVDENISQQITYETTSLVTAKLELQSEKLWSAVKIYGTAIEGTTAGANEVISERAAGEKISERAPLWEEEVPSVGELDAGSKGELLDENVVTGTGETTTLANKGILERAADEKISQRPTDEEIITDEVLNAEGATAAEVSNEETSPFTVANLECQNIKNLQSPVRTYVTETEETASVAIEEISERAVNDDAITTTLEIPAVVNADIPIAAEVLGKLQEERVERASNEETITTNSDTPTVLNAEVPVAEVSNVLNEEILVQALNEETITVNSGTPAVVNAEVPIAAEVPNESDQETLPADVEAQNIDKLRAAVRHHSYLYNTLDAPIISDAAYDSLVRELEKLEILASQKVSDANLVVGSEPLSTMLKVAHSVPMLSLASEQDEKEVLLWNERLQQKLGPTHMSLEWVVEPKVDGLALSLIYENGNLKYALTRGNGMQGEDVTHNAQNVLGIPLTIPHLPGTGQPLKLLEVRGEIFMSLKHFKELNASKLKAGEKPFANPRNAAAGSMRLLSAENNEGRPLSFIAYNVANANVAKPEKGRSERILQVVKTQWEALRLLHSLGFVVNDDNKLFNTFDSALAYAKGWKDQRHTLEYEADGVVLKVNDLSTQALLGTAGGAPRWALAWKFAATEAVTVLEGIKLTVGRTGVIIPNARLKPVELGGVTVSRASLHNVRHVIVLGLCEGDHIIIQRAGDVIPQVVQVLEELRPSEAKPWLPPKSCPSCESKLSESTASPMIFCQNLSCPSRQSRQVEHFAKTLISGLGSTALRQLEEDGLVVEPADLYHLDTEALSNIKGFGKLSAAKLLKAIEDSKQKQLSLFVAALGIPRVGITTAEGLAKQFESLGALLNASEKDLLLVPGIGEATAAAIYEWCHSKTNIEFVNKLEAAGCNINPAAEKHASFVDPTTEVEAQNGPSTERHEESTSEEGAQNCPSTEGHEEPRTEEGAQNGPSPDKHEESVTEEGAQNSLSSERHAPFVEPTTEEGTQIGLSTERNEWEPTTEEGARSGPSTEGRELLLEPTTVGGAQNDPVLAGDTLVGESGEGSREELDMSPEVEAVAVPKLHGKVVVITGDFGDVLRKDIGKLIKLHGGSFRTTVTSKTNLLVLGNRPGQEKLSLAKEKGVEIVDWAKFQKLIA